MVARARRCSTPRRRRASRSCSAGDAEQAAGDGDAEAAADAGASQARAAARARGRRGGRTRRVRAGRGLAGARCGGGGRRLRRRRRARRAQPGAAVLRTASRWSCRARRIARRRRCRRGAGGAAAGAGASAAAGGAGGKVNINTATAAELDTLPGVGAVDGGEDRRRPRGQRSLRDGRRTSNACPASATRSSRRSRTRLRRLTVSPRPAPPLPPRPALPPVLALRPGPLGVLRRRVRRRAVLGGGGVRRRGRSGARGCGACRRRAAALRARHARTMRPAGHPRSAPRAAAVPGRPCMSPGRRLPARRRGGWRFEAVEDADAGLYGAQCVARTRRHRGARWTCGCASPTAQTCRATATCSRRTASLAAPAERSAACCWQRGVAAVAPSGRRRRSRAHDALGVLLGVRARALEVLGRRGRRRRRRAAGARLRWRGALDEGDVYAAFKASGLAHLVAVSGAHLVMVCAFAGAAL